MILCNELEIPVSGVDLPLHFILAYKGDGDPFLNFNEHGDPDNDILFYINPFSNGIIFSKNDIDQFLNQQNIEPTAQYYKPCSNLDIVKRVLRNLIYSYEKENKEDKAEELKALLNDLNQL